MLEEVAPGVAFFKGFSNLTVARAGDELVLVDTGSFHPKARAKVFEAVRAWSDAPLRAAFYTHGHVDHAYGLPPFLEEAERLGGRRPDVVAHRRVRARMARYVETAEFNALINERQFGHAVRWPVDPVLPSIEFDAAIDLSFGGTTFEARHARGETDDHAWVFLPERKVLCTGDFFIWAAPNCGNPQKVQRYPHDWAVALRKMAALGAEVLLPGHGLPIWGADRVRTALLDSAEYLESLWRDAVRAINSGADLDELIRTVRPPERLADRPWLRPIYDEPEFVVRNIHRLLCGWHSGRASDLKPPSRADEAREVAALAGGAARLADRAKSLADAGDFRLACRLIDWAADAAPDDDAIRETRGELYERRVAIEPSTMSKGIFGAEARACRGERGT